MRVLFVDDDEGVSQSVEAGLRNKGHTCQITGSGGEAISLAKQNDYDIVVLDVALPDMDGCHVVRRFKMEEIDTPILLQTGFADGELTAEAASLGIEEILNKPFSVAELIERIEATVFYDEPAETAAAPAPEAEAATGQDAGQDLGAEQDGDERRRQVRHELIEAALITDGHDPIACVILNMSEGGAALELVEEGDCPDVFTLQQLDGPERRCEVRWRKGELLGIAFV